MTLDSLRYWADVVGVDGFRFDLAVTLGRDPGGFSPDHPALVAMAIEPVAARPQARRGAVGRRPRRLAHRAVPGAVRRVERPLPQRRPLVLAGRPRPRRARPARATASATWPPACPGSVDLFGHSDPPLVRGPSASVNYVTAHDGFTLADLVAYDHKHNAANGEQNRDGSDDNRSWNHGIEGHVGARLPRGRTSCPCAAARSATCSPPSCSPRGRR